MIDAAARFAGHEDLGGTAANPWALGMEGSDILAIAAEIGARKAAGEAVANFTVGDFDPKLFPIPPSLRDLVTEELAAGQTNYPPAVGIPELRKAIAGFYREKLGLGYRPEDVLVASGARPPIYAAFATIVAPGDGILYSVPSWNVRYYVYLSGGRGIPVTARPEAGFMPTADDFRPHLASARIIYLNSPLNPCGTVIEEEALRGISKAVVEENARRRKIGERPLFLLYDMVYWQLAFGGGRHLTPVHLVPEIAPYTLLVDAISKSWAATGLRVGWAVVPPPLYGPMQALIGHIGAWAPRAEQRATARILAEPGRVDGFMDEFRGALERRLNRLYESFAEMEAAGLPVHAVPARGAIYLSVRFDIPGCASADAVRRWLLDRAGVGVVPFTAFGYPSDTHWVRFSVGACSEADVEGALARLRAALGGR